ncbi:MAG: class I SAM-dependent methyltransferase [Phycisphaerae bacterium]|nr:class I SAM-dependent methyltransferase [Phycisphaerae bacterium]
MLYQTIHACRVCSNNKLETVLDLGSQALTGIFPPANEPIVAEGPLELCYCPECTLVQMRHTYNPLEMYGSNYGYRSGLNQSMVQHLQAKAAYLTRLGALKAGDWVLDIGSNDGTLLGLYAVEGLNLAGIDPSSAKFKSYYKKGILRVEEFFSASRYRDISNHQKAALVTSIAMFYDLDNPVEFAGEIHDILTEDGLWHFEQSYLPAMLRTNSFDTVCHEHAEYYSLHSVQNILKRAGMKILEVSFNDVNGGSFAVTACRKESGRVANTALLDWVYASETLLKLNTPIPVLDLGRRIKTNMTLLVDLLERLARAGKTVVGYGASTKGNVMLQYAGITRELLPAIAEVNPDKFGHVTPGTQIPIVSDSEARAMKPDYFLVLPWHFRNDILAREQEYLCLGGHFIFPMPEPEIV